MRTVVVTGGSTHIGRAIAELAASEGDRVFIASRDLERCRSVAGEITANHGSCEGLPCDVTNPQSVKELISRVLDASGRLDVMICNAGGSTTEATFPGSDPDEVIGTIETNLVGSYLCSQEAAHQMVAERKGSIVLVASIFGMIASEPTLYSDIQDFRPTGPAYHAAKGGVIQLTRSLAARLGGYGVRVNCVSPGVVPRPGEVPDKLLERFAARTPLRRAGRPEEIARAVRFLAGDQASFITGHNLVVDGGWTAQ